MPEAMRKLLIETVTFHTNARQQFYFFGPIGTGKTCAAACIWRGWLEECGYFRTGNKSERYPDGASRIWFTTAQFLIPAMVEGKFSGGSVKYLNRIRKTKLLVLDDIGWRGMTEPQRDALRDIIETRGNQPTIWTGNFSPDELGIALGDERIGSRLAQFADGIGFDGADRRIEKMNVYFP